jgi:hypothetical protein
MKPVYDLLICLYIPPYSSLFSKIFSAIFVNVGKTDIILQLAMLVDPRPLSFLKKTALDVFRGKLIFLA